MLKKLFDNTKSNSLANRFRRKRLRIFERFISDMAVPVKILDIGGTENFWHQMGYSGNNDYLITIVNIENINITGANINYIRADARDISCIESSKFDVVFSNSVIEHVGGIEDMRKMAEGIRKLNIRYMVQTPNFYFPMEPHFMFPCFQFLPGFVQLFLLMNFNIGWYKKCSNKKEARELIDSIHLLRLNELKELFPGSMIYKERFLGLVKSYIAYGEGCE